MPAQYCTWAKVQQYYPQADLVEPTAGDQTTLIEQKTNFFRAFLRSTRKTELTAPYDEPVQIAVAQLVVDELKRRAMTDDSDLVFQEFKHVRGMMTDSQAEAHSLIEGMLSGDVILTEDPAEHDLEWPASVPAAGNTGNGVIHARLPYGYEDTKTGIYYVEFTTAGRVDDGTAKYKWHYNNSETANDTGVVPTGDLAEIAYGLYLSFVDGSRSGDSFDLGDNYTITCYHRTEQARTHGPQQIDYYSG